MNDPPTNNIEPALAELVLTAPAIDRDALMHRAGYAAGEAAARRRPALQVWRAAACVSAAACLVLALSGREAAPSSRIANDPPASPSVLSSRSDVATDHFAWDLDGRLAVRIGAAKPPLEVDDAAASAPSNNAPPTAQQLLNEILSQLAAGDEA
jgi:hypothetical protein